MLLEPAPKPPPEPSITNGGPGFMLSSSFSTGIAAGEGAGVFSGVLASGVFIAIPVLGGKNLPGYFN